MSLTSSDKNALGGGRVHTTEDTGGEISGCRTAEVLILLLISLQYVYLGKSWVSVPVKLHSTLKNVI